MINLRMISYLVMFKKKIIDLIFVKKLIIIFAFKPENEDEGDNEVDLNETIQDQ